MCQAAPPTVPVPALRGATLIPSRSAATNPLASRGDTLIAFPPYRMPMKSEPSPKNRLFPARAALHSRDVAQANALSERTHAHIELAAVCDTIGGGNQGLLWTWRIARFINWLRSE